MGGADVRPEGVQKPRRSQRPRTLTEKGKEMQERIIKALQQGFNYIYNKWRIHAKSVKQPLSQSMEPLSEDLLNDVIGDVTSLSANVQRVYDEICKVSTPDQKILRRVDLCVEMSRFIVSRASCRLDGKIPEGEEEDWPEVGSLFNSSACKTVSVTSMLKGASEHSSRSSVK